MHAQPHKSGAKPGCASRSRDSPIKTDNEFIQMIIGYLDRYPTCYLR